MPKEVPEWSEIPDHNIPEEQGKLPSKHTSLLLGAGFSVNQGYPTANQLNDRIKDFDPEKYSISGEGNLFKLSDSEKDPFWFYSDAKRKHFLKELIHLFLQSNSEFDYEEFYDFLVDPSLLENDAFKATAQAFRKKFNLESDDHLFEYGDSRLVDKTITLVNQIIEVLLVDGQGRNFYKPIHQMKPLPHEYTGFLQLLEKLGKDSIVHIHSLNHDIFFETFCHTDWINSELSNGFEELGSKFYARMEDSVMIRLAYFNDKYDARFRLYKLHGSIDQFPFRHEDGSPTEYIKIKKGVNISNLYKEVYNEEREYYYENDFTNYYADFLSGTSNKILSYDRGYYKVVFTHFVENLKNSEQLIIVGYGCRDSKINELILENFDFGNKPVFIVDPYPSEHVKILADKLGAKIIEQTPDRPLLGIIDSI